MQNYCQYHKDKMENQQVTPDQVTPDVVISIESAALEFSNAFSLTIARLVTEKLELKNLNGQLIACIEKQKETIEQLEREVSLAKSTPEP